MGVYLFNALVRDGPLNWRQRKWPQKK